MGENTVRKPILYVAAAAVVLGVGVLVWHFVLGWYPFGAGSFGSTVRVLCAATSAAAGGEQVDSVAVLTLEDGRVGTVFIPADLWIKSADGSSGRLADLAAREGWTAACRAVGPVLGVSVTRYVVLDEEDLAALLALFPSLSVSVTDPVTSTEPSGRRGAGLRVSAGDQALSPEAAWVFLRGASRTSRADRDRQAYEAVRYAGRSLLADKALRRAVRDVAAGVSTNLSVDGCVTLWTEIARASVAASAVLPTREAVVGGAKRRLLSVAEASDVVAAIIRGDEVVTPAGVTVAVFNGNGVRLSASRAAGYLRARGFRVAATANADSFSYATSYIVVLTDEAKAWMLREALPGEAEVVSRETFASHLAALRGQVPEGTDLVFVVGAGMEFAG
ncbi:MAG: LCP family protein [Candidatus Bipolaricaulia bacterium]